MAVIIDGAEIARQVQEEVRRSVEELHRRRGVTPGFAVVLVGGDQAAAYHARKKEQACQDAGIFCRVFHLPQKTSQDEALALVQQLNGDTRFHGILPQLPFPPHIDEAQVIRALVPAKDVDCMHPLNLGLLALGAPAFVPAAVLAVQQLLVRTGNGPAGKSVAVCGSNIVSRSLALLLAQGGREAAAGVTLCPAETPGLADLTRRADILIAALDSPGAITAAMVKPGAAVIDASLVRTKDEGRRRGYRVVGCVDFGPVSRVASAITPVPGGVGPMTIAALLVNTVKAALLSTESARAGACQPSQPALA